MRPNAVRMLHNFPTKKKRAKVAGKMPRPSRVLPAAEKVDGAKRKPGKVEKKNVARHEASGRSHAVDPFVNMVPASASFPSLPYSMRYAASPLAVADSKRGSIYMCGGPPPPSPTNIYASKAPVHHFFVLFFNFLPFWFTENHLLP